MPAFWATPPTVTVKLQALVLYNCNKGVWPKKQALMYKGVWPKKQVNKPLLKPAMFCHTLCRGQNLKILPSNFDHCSQNVWWTPTQNWWSKRCCLGDPIPIWSWTKSGGTYGIPIYCEYVVLCQVGFSSTWPQKSLWWQGLQLKKQYCPYCVHLTPLGIWSHIFYFKLGD